MLKKTERIKRTRVNNSDPNKRIFVLNDQQLTALKIYCELHDCKVGVSLLPIVTFKYPNGNVEHIDVRELVKSDFDEFSPYDDPTRFNL